MIAAEFEARIVAWAGSRPDVEALVQIGSRVQRGGTVDEWSDWDYQLIVRNTSVYNNREWPSEIAPCWSAHFERTERGVVKVSAVFEGGVEADFVLLSAWQIKLVCWAMRFPRAEPWFPKAVARGVRNLQLVAAPGYRVLRGGSAWERRYYAINYPWPTERFSQRDLDYHTAAFWRHAVWVAKKILRGELRAAIRWAQVEMHDHTLALLAEEARLEGSIPRPEARQAEHWLTELRLTQTRWPIAPDRKILANQLLAEMTLFGDLSRNISARRGFTAGNYSDLETWLRSQLSRIAN